jgi:hypothetical protein
MQSSVSYLLCTAGLLLLLLLLPLYVHTSNPESCYGRQA